MKTMFKFGAACALVIAAPAAAQLLGGGVGGGLGGSLGGSLGGTLGGGLGQVGGVARGTLDAGSAVRIDRTIDRHSGRAAARGSGEARGGAGLDGAASSLLGSGDASARGDARASGSGEIGVQAIGTDALGRTAGAAAGTARGLAGSASGTASGSGSASGGGNGGAAFGPLSAAGSAAASAAGAVSVAPGMIVRDGAGRAIGRVQDVRAAADGLVDTVLVRIGDRIAALPAENFSVSGETLVSAMSRGEVRREARRQENGG